MEKNRVKDTRLIEVGIALFGRYGLDGASTRAIAGAAGRPVSTIAYQFGGKEGLYLACARYIADTFGARLAPAPLAGTIESAQAARVSRVSAARW